MAAEGQAAGTTGGPSGAGAADTRPPGGTSPAAAHAAATDDDAFAQRPELFVGAAFAGGLVLAQVLRRLGR